ncbi:MAG: phosphatidylserine decarboxylase family protein [Deltaproteobacteria bacterium]|nr:phosphatidylserine decarboxylase family protein [Deltaproteobacteria bacterium]
MRIPLAREGAPFIVLSAAVTALVFFSGLRKTSVVFLALSWFVVWFFRDPRREIPGEPGSIVSPADGRVIKVEKAREERLLMDEALKISIFMNVFNVHVNRAPYDAGVLKVLYNPGRFLSADLDKASEENERNSILMEARGKAEGGRRFVVCQIAGLIARRIVCRVSEGSAVKKGDRIGMIRFGSRLDVYLPPSVRIKVKVGDKVKAGSSILGWW